jgi:hypothetical protein
MERVVRRQKGRGEPKAGELYDWPVVRSKKLANFFLGAGFFDLPTGARWPNHLFVFHRISRIKSPGCVDSHQYQVALTNKTMFGRPNQFFEKSLLAISS